MEAGLFKRRKGSGLHPLLPIPRKNLEAFAREIQIAYTTLSFRRIQKSVICRALTSSVAREYTPFTYPEPTGPEEIHMFGVEFPA